MNYVMYSNGFMLIITTLIIIMSVHKYLFIYVTYMYLRDIMSLLLYYCVIEDAREMT